MSSKDPGPRVAAPPRREPAYLRWHCAAGAAIVAYGASTNSCRGSDAASPFAPGSLLHTHQKVTVECHSM